VAAALAWASVPGVLAGAQGARFALYFILWYAGVALARVWLAPEDAGARRALDRCLAHIVLLALLFAGLAAGGGVVPDQTGAVTPWRELRHLLCAALLLAACRFGIAGRAWQTLRRSAAGRWIGDAAVRLGGISYALYALHFPLVVGTSPAYAGLPAPAGVALAAAACFALAWAPEQRAQPALNRLLRRGADDR